MQSLWTQIVGDDFACIDFFFLFLQVYFDPISTILSSHFSHIESFTDCVTDNTNWDWISSTQKKTSFFFIFEAQGPAKNFLSSNCVTTPVQ